MKKNITYYPHLTESHQHPKFKLLRSSYANQLEGWAAEGRFWALNNIIASSDNCRLDLSKKRNVGMCADDLGMSIKDFEEFISLLKSEDIELIIEVEPNIYSTKVVLETYEAVENERKKAKEKYYRSKKEFSEENLGFSSEKRETSGENLYKENEIKENEIKENEIKENEIKYDFYFSKYFSFVQSLFSLTPIKVNIDKHIKPIIQLFCKVYHEKISEQNICRAIKEEFSKLPKDKPIKIEYLVNNIETRIINNLEEVIKNEKKILIKEAYKDRQEEINAWRLKINKYREFINNNGKLFSEKELKKVNNLLGKGSVLEAGVFIEPKMAKDVVNK